jgi:hypothetical protein
MFIYNGVMLMLGLRKKYDDKDYLMYVVIDFQRDIYTIPNREIVPIKIKDSWQVFKVKTEQYKSYYKSNVKMKHCFVLTRYEKNHLNNDLAFVRHYGEFDIY